MKKIPKRSTIQKRYERIAALHAQGKGAGAIAAELHLKRYTVANALMAIKRRQPVLALKPTTGSFADLVLAKIPPKILAEAKIAAIDELMRAA